MEKLDGKTFDIVSDNINKLEELFPEIVTEGKVDVDKLALLFDKGRNEDTEGKKDGEERYEFTWKGKKEAIRMAQKQTTGTLRPCREESVNFDETQNLYIEGDNLEVLRALQSSYRGKVKMIYIDPPYNTGQDFVYKDDFNDNVKNYKEKMNESYKTNTDSTGRLHTNWLNMMYPRLKLAKNLLDEDGIIFISISEIEFANTKKLCDEIFGAYNFVEIFTWTRTSTPPSLSHKSRKTVEYIICYEKNKNTNRYFGEALENGDAPLLNTGNAEKEIKFPPKTIKFTYLENGNIQKGKYEKTEFITDCKVENGTNIQEVIIKGEFKWTQEKTDSEIKNGTYFLIKSDKMSMRFQRISVDSYKTPTNFISEKSYECKLDQSQGIGTNESASSELAILNMKGFFDYTKPVSLIKYILNFNNNKEGIILDFFSGSSTTAHAVMQMNVDDGGNRKFIMVQLPEETDEKSEAYKNGYKNICEIGKERIRRAGKKIVEENKDKEGIEDLDIGFKVFKLDTTNIKEWDDTIQDTEEIKQMAMELDNPIKGGRSQEDVIYEILLKYGVDLTMPIEEVEIMGSKVYSVGFGYLMICLEEDINLDLIEAIGEQKPNRVVLYDNGLDNESKTNGERILKELGVKDIRTI